MKARLYLVTVPLALAATPARPADPSSLPPAPAAPFADAARVDARALAVVRGRDDTAQIVRADNRATVSNNVVSGQSQTGMIQFDGQAFQNQAGLALLSANTGNNVAINSSLNVNVTIRP